MDSLQQGGRTEVLVKDIYVLKYAEDLGELIGKITILNHSVDIDRHNNSFVLLFYFVN